MRVIKTARDVESINAGAREGFFPLVKALKPSPEIRSKFAVLQDQATGEIKVLGDYRSHRGDERSKLVVSFTFYYPHHFESPFAAYLVPKDIQVGERVLLEDLIEDFVGARWNQGDVYRLESCEAVWNGTDFDVLYDPEIASRNDFVG